ncbi:coproporphyrinogen III oxidase [Methylosinus sp. C49]|jgi:oxygen-independent coproporphyrinogen-3 oxidase|uniref:radical SAM family heme chaperone HemW n=1 Tax=unclassified Methylosinus TaxID=2624500 RepID=UPI000466DABB|nr:MULTISPECIES: radical SAM family heme chaperone HemW [unclassified Methylosinus]OAI25996.1 coproporphyrinogen III oxidase [Methylosinus sp. R-45379]TDX64928.1 oxygen-independent coproporphyrinogen-3 oxidase [Methylosinus sp. sav-2]BBU61905.1 coproporphyrinogen III oxidase [Methylosinus sp. C49]
MAATIRNAFDPGFGVYVHWPFCLSKCPYCDFNSHVRKGEVDEDRFVDAFRTEIAHRAALAPGREVRSVFFGGGTPSLMLPSTLEAILRAIADHWPMAADCEVTLEANPTSVEASRFRSFKAAGVNRASLGVQALNDIELRALGRQHSVAEALAALDVANKIFERTSFDLIYARPQQTPAAWRKELELALGRVTEHVSLYQLTIEPETMFERMVDAGKLDLPDVDTQRALWDVTQEVTARAGLPAYEVSNHARPGSECRHNLVYWRYGEYAGVGPGAHGRLITPRGRRAQATEKHPEMWLTCVETEGHGLVEDDLLSAEQEGDEFLLMGLRLREGIDPARFFALTGKKLSQSRVAELIGDGLVELTRDNRIRVSSEGFPVLDAVVADLAA